MKRILSGLAIVVLIQGLGMSAFAKEKSPLVLGVLEIRGLDSLSAAGFDVSKAIGQPMPKEMITMLLHGALGTMPGMGILSESTIRAVAFQAEGDRIGWAVMLPVSDDGTDYLESLAMNEWEEMGETSDGLLHYQAPDGGMLPVQDVYFLERGATLIAGCTPSDVHKAEAVRLSLPKILPIEGDIAVQIRPAALATAFGSKMLEQISASLQNAPVAHQADAQKIADSFSTVPLDIAKQVQEIVFGLGIANGNVNFHSRIAPVPETLFAQWMETLQPPGDAVQVLALSDALFLTAGNSGDLQLLLAPYLSLMEQITSLALSDADPATRQRIVATELKHEKTVIEQLLGDYGISLLPPTAEAPLRVAFFYALKNPSILRPLLPELIQHQNEIEALTSAQLKDDSPYKSLTTLGEPREYRAVAIDRMTFTLEPAGNFAAMWPAFLPKQFDVECAWIPGGVLVTMGDASMTDLLVDRALDGNTTPFTARRAWKELFPNAEQPFVDMSTLAVFSAMRSVCALSDENPEFCAKIPASEGNISGASYLSDGGYMSRLRIRLADIAAAVKLYQ